MWHSARILASRAALTSGDLLACCSSAGVTNPIAVALQLAQEGTQPLALGRVRPM